MSNPIHYLKGRKSDYLAGTDLEIFDLEGKSKRLTIVKVDFFKELRVNGINRNKILLITFKEEYAKPFIVNTTNSKIIKEQTGIIDASKWVGFTLEFYFDTNVEMKRQKVGGIRIKSVDTNGLTPSLEDIDNRLSKCTNRAEIMSLWNELTELQQTKYKEGFANKIKLL